MMEFRAILKWVLSPLLYAAGGLSLFVVPLASFAFLERQVSSNAGVIGVMLVFLGICSLVFVLLGIGLAHLERLRPPTIRDHLRHCALLYAGMVLLVTFIVFTYDAQYCCRLQWSLAVILVMVSAYAAVVDALTIFILARRSRP